MNSGAPATSRLSQPQDAQLACERDEVDRQRTLTECQTEAATDGIFTTSDRATILRLNSALREMWGIGEAIRPGDDARTVGKHIATKLIDATSYRRGIERLLTDPSATIPPDALEPFLAWLQDQDPGVSGHWADFSLLRKNGERFSAECAVARKDAEAGASTTLFVRDVSKSKRLDAELGELPPVTCYAGELNQALLNVLVKVAHAIRDVVGTSGKMGRIRMRTWCDGPSAYISISDTGAGIPEAIRERIFEPFFTTKSVGRGTGQGLAITRSVVVDKHQGDLTFDTAEGVGTTFVIRLPVDPIRTVASDS